MIAIAPFSNDALRDWPIGYYGTLVDLCLANLAEDVVLIGAGEQRQAIDCLVRGRPVSRVRNMAGVWSWPQTVENLRQASLIVANNSGLAHLGGQLGVPTLCIFAASHDPMEWGPRGPNVRLLYTDIECSPCAMSTASGCPFGHECMVRIEPKIVFREARNMLEAAPVLAE